MHAVLAGVTWNPEVKGVLIVVTAALVFPGSIYLVLSTNLGSRLGFVVALTGLMGWISIMGWIWAVYGIGKNGPAPLWRPKTVFSGSVANSTQPQLAGFPAGWKTIALDKPRASEASAAADGALVSSSGGGVFKASSDYRAVAVFDRGGQRYGWLGLNFRPFNVRHKPHFVVVEVEALCTTNSTDCTPPATVVGQPPPKPVADPNQPHSYVLMERDLGAFRLPAVIVAVSATVMFLVLCYVLHRRDKIAWAARSSPATA